MVEGDQSSTEMSVELAKKALRGDTAKKLAAIPISEIVANSALTAQKLRSLKVYEAARSIAFYMHMSSGELQTDQMLQAAFSDNKRVFLPQISRLGANAQKLYPGQKSHLRMLEMQTINDVNALAPRGKYQIREPLDGEDCLDNGGLDLIIMPGVAFSSTCERLGHGGAFYDCFIREHYNKIGKRPKLIAVSLPEQMVESIPTEVHDIPVDAVVVGSDVHFRAEDSTRV